MPVTVEKLPDEPILISTYLPPQEPDDHANNFARLAELVDGMEGPIYRITDLSQIKIKFTDIVVALAEETRGQKPGSAADPRVRSILVATGTLIELAAKSISQDQYGKVNAPVLFTDLDEALVYAREQIAQEVAPA